MFGPPVFDLHTQTHISNGENWKSNHWVYTWWREVWSFVLQGPVNGFRPSHSDALLTQNIAHFFNLSDSFFQVVRGKWLPPILLVEGPILLVCVGLLTGFKLFIYSLIQLWCHMPLHGHYKRGHLDCITYFNFQTEGRHVGVFSATHDHLLQRVPFIVAAHGTFLLHGLSNMFLLNCALWVRSCCTGSALEGPLRPSSHRAAKLEELVGGEINNNNIFAALSFYAVGVKLKTRGEALGKKNIWQHLTNTTWRYKKEGKKEVAFKSYCCIFISQFLFPCH